MATHEARTKRFLKGLSNNPKTFIKLLRDFIGVTLSLEGEWGTWDIEEQILLATFETPEVAEVYVRAGNSTGKTATAGIVGNAHLFCRYPGYVFYLSTKKEQAKAQAWSEFLQLYKRIRAWCLKEQLTGTILGKPWPPEPFLERVEFADNWWARVYAGQIRGDKDKATGWSGFHNKYQLFVVDEAPGVPDNAHEMITGNITGRHNILLAQGNPLVRQGWWHRGQQDPIPKYRKVFSISAKSSPNYLYGKWCEENGLPQPEDDLIPGLASYEWIKRKEQDHDYRPGTPYHDGHIRGEFPTQQEGGLISWQDIQRAAERSHGWQECIEALGYEDWRNIFTRLGRDQAICAIEQYAEEHDIDILLPDFNRLAIGVDVADTGGNLSAISVLAGDKLLEQRMIDGKASVVVPAEVEQCLREYETWTVGVDKPGVGSGPSAILQERGIDVLEFKGGIPAEESDERQEFTNLNAEMAWSLRARFIDNAIEIPDDEPLKRQLGSILWQFTEGGRVKVPKPSPSPDRFDSLRIAHWAQTLGDYSPSALGDQLPAYSSQFGTLGDW